MPRLILDPYILTATADITAKQVFDCASSLYPDCNWDWSHDEEVVAKWLATMRRKPGLALSTGRTKTDRGMFTCGLLKVLGVERPRGVRSRMEVAWDILDSAKGRASVGHDQQLEQERKHWLRATGREVTAQGNADPASQTQNNPGKDVWPFPQRIL